MRSRQNRGAVRSSRAPLPSCAGRSAPSVGARPRGRLRNDGMLHGSFGRGAADPHRAHRLAGLSAPVGPAMPVTATETSLPSSRRAPRAICRATNSSTAPCRASTSSETPKFGLHLVHVAHDAAAHRGRRPRHGSEHGRDEAAGEALGRGHRGPCGRRLRRRCAPARRWPSAAPRSRWVPQKGRPPLQFWPRAPLQQMARFTR